MAPPFVVLIQTLQKGDTMKYALLIYSDEAAWQNASEEKRQEVYAGHRRLGEELQERNANVSGFELQPAASATTVRVENGSTVTSDGPYAETKEALGGFYVVDLPNLDDAIEMAALIPVVGTTIVEIRPAAE
jgi:hypothetical protein